MQSSALHLKIIKHCSAPFRSWQCRVKVKACSCSLRNLRGCHLDSASCKNHLNLGSLRKAQRASVGPSARGLGKATLSYALATESCQCCCGRVCCLPVTLGRKLAKTGPKQHQCPASASQSPSPSQKQELDKSCFETHSSKSLPSLFACQAIVTVTPVRRIPQSVCCIP